MSLPNLTTLTTGNPEATEQDLFEVIGRAVSSGNSQMLGTYYSLPRDFVYDVRITVYRHVHRGMEPPSE